MGKEASGSSSRGCSDGYDQRYSNRNGKTRDSNYNGYMGADFTKFSAFIVYDVKNILSISKI